MNNLLFKKIDAVPNSLQFFYFGTFVTVQTLHATSVQRYTFFCNEFGTVPKNIEKYPSHKHKNFG